MNENEEIIPKIIEVEEIIPKIIEVEEIIPKWVLLNHKSEIAMEWFEKNLDYHYLRDFIDLNENSLIVDIGMYTGVWLKDMYCKYRCNCIGIEPVLEYFNKAKDILTDSSKIKLYNYGVYPGKKTINERMYIAGEGSFINFNKEHIETPWKKITLKPISSFFANIDQHIDVLQINIEGSEYKILPYMVKHDLFKYVNNIQIQFHDIIPQSHNNMTKIIDSIKKSGFELLYNYDYFWCGFKNIK